MSAPAAVIRKRRRRTLDVLGVVSGKIATILAGQNVTLADVLLPQEARPGETPLERLRRFAAELQATLAALDRGEAPACATCGGEIAAANLDDMPWATTCARCAAG